jgi:hypothetical protein
MWVARLYTYIAKQVDVTIPATAKMRQPRETPRKTLQMRTIAAKGNGILECHPFSP